MSQTGSSSSKVLLCANLERSELPREAGCMEESRMSIDLNALLAEPWSRRPCLPCASCRLATFGRFSLSLSMRRASWSSQVEQ